MKIIQSIVLINCYFGKFPWYFPFFIKSCSTNPTVNFVIFSDAIYTAELPKNVKIISFSLATFNQLATEKLGFKVVLKNAYKLCDFKPAYGVIFSDYLAKYDFWGMCDIDIILGRIREFITDEMLDTFDIINTRHDYLTGSFMLFRNDDVANNLFAKSKDYKKVFESNKHYCFDECNFKHAYIENEMNIFDVDCEIESMEHVIRKEMESERIKVFYDFLVIDGLSGKLKWDNGILGYDNKFEILLYHLIQYKSNILAQKEFWSKIPEVFFIDKYTFRKKSKKSIVGVSIYIYYNYIKPLVSKTIQILDCLLSAYIFPKMILNIDTGLYKNKLGHNSIEIKKDENGKIIFTDIDIEAINSKNSIFQSKFNKNTFYKKGVIYEKFKKNQSIFNKTTNIYKNQLDGSFTNFEIQKEFTN